jgi:hypothetical protein
MAEAARELLAETADYLAQGNDPDELLEKLYQKMLGMPDVTMTDLAATAANLIIQAGLIILGLVPESLAEESA